MVRYPDLVREPTQKEDINTLEKNNISTSIQEEIVEVHVPNKLKIDTLHSSNEKTNEELVMSGFRSDVVQFSNVKYQGKYFVILGGTRMTWRLKSSRKIIIWNKI